MKVKFLRSSGYMNLLERKISTRKESMSTFDFTPLIFKYKVGFLLMKCKRGMKEELHALC